MVVINFIAMYISVGLVCLVLYFIFVSYVGRRGSRIVLNKALRVSTARDFIEFNSAKAVYAAKSILILFCQFYSNHREPIKGIKISTIIIIVVHIFNIHFNFYIIPRVAVNTENVFFHKMKEN